MKPVAVTIMSLSLFVFALLVLHCPRPTNAHSVLLAENAEKLIRLLYAKQVKNIEDGVSDVNSIASKDAQCKCIDYNCGCCAHITVPKVKLDDTCCVNVSYLPTEYGISVVFMIGKHVIFNATVSAKNPPPICVGIPYLEKEASVCIRFYNLDYSDHRLSGCIKLEVRLVFVLVESFDFGCFQFPVAGSLEADRGALALLAALKHDEKAALE